MFNNQSKITAWDEHSDPENSDGREFNPGWFDSGTGITLLGDAETKEALASWLQVKEIDPKDLRSSNL